jgi:guanylate kinase
LREINISPFSQEEIRLIRGLQTCILILTGSNGAGKSELLKLLSQKVTNTSKVPRVTTRGKRPEEVENLDYHFVLQIGFDEMIDNHLLLDWAEFPFAWYGTAKQDIIAALQAGKYPTMDVDIEAALALIQSFRESGIPFKDIFISPVDPLLLDTAEGVETAVSILEKRMLARNPQEKSAVLRSRTTEARERLPLWRQFSYVVINSPGNTKSAAEQLVKIVATATDPIITL